MNEKVNLNEFKKMLSNIKEAESITGATYYHSIQVSGSTIKFIRNGKYEYESISVQELYDFYKNISDVSDIKTTTARKYISGRVQSPATAILTKLVYDNQLI
jgi:hypothetical protein